MKHKVSELTGALLNAAVADIEIPGWRGFHGTPMLRELKDDGFHSRTFRPTEFWEDAGPIIEREGIWLECEAGRWTAKALNDDGVYIGEHTSPLAAAMRAYVASKFGDEVDL